MDQQSQSDALQAAIEREVRHLIGDLHMKVIALHTMLGMAQAQQPGQAPSEPKPVPQPAPTPAPSPQPGDKPQPDTPTPAAKRGNGSTHEVAS